MDFECTSNLIRAVREIQIIWDPKMPGHSDRVAVAKAWAKVAEKMNMTEDCVPALKNKWAYLRDTFKRKKRENTTVSGQAAKSKKEWAHFPELCFLDPSVERWRNTSNCIVPMSQPRLFKRESSTLPHRSSQEPDTVCGCQDEENVLGSQPDAVDIAIVENLGKNKTSEEIFYQFIAKSAEEHLPLPQRMKLQKATHELLMKLIEESQLMSE